MSLNTRKKKHDALARRLASVVKRLSSTAAAEEAMFETQRTSQLLLAEGILHHKVMFQLVKPLQTPWVQQHHSPSPTESLLSQLSRPHLHCTPWAILVPLAAAANPMLHALVTADSAKIKLMASLSAEDAAQETMACVEQLIMLQEMLSVTRYPAELMTAGDQRSFPSGSSEGDHEPDTTAAAAAAAAAHADPLEQDLKQAAKQLLDHLQQFAAAWQTAAAFGAILVLHAPQVTFELCSMNLATRERCSPPASHYLQAVRRLRLTSKQVQHLQLLLRQFNRMSRRLHDSGEQLVTLSADSFSLSTQTGLSALQCTGAAGDDQQSSPGESVWAGQPAAARRQEPSAAASGEQQSSDTAEAGRQPEADSAALEQGLQQLLASQCDLHVLMGMWVSSTLTPWQLGSFMVACWPYQPFLSSLVEFSCFLTPDDSVPLQINPAISPEAAQAAALADQLGFTGAHAFMEARCALLSHQVELAQLEVDRVLHGV